jgi:ATP-binding cassette subfamily B multidrug efflux pump
MSKHNESNSSQGTPAFGAVMAIEKPKHFGYSAKRLINYFYPFKLHLIAVLVMVIVSTTFTVAAPEILGKVTTELYKW